MDGWRQIESRLPIQPGHHQQGTLSGVDNTRIQREKRRLKRINNNSSSSSRRKRRIKMITVEEGLEAAEVLVVEAIVEVEIMGEEGVELAVDGEEEEEEEGLVVAAAAVVVGAVETHQTHFTMITDSQIHSKILLRMVKS